MVQKKHQNVFDSRSRVLTVVFLLFFAAIIARLYYLQVVKASSYKQQAQNQHSIYRKLLPTRGEIKIADPISAESFPIAANIEKFLVYAVPHEIVNPNLVAQSLSSVLALSAPEILTKITNLEKKYVPLKKELTENEQNVIKQLKLPGIYFDTEEKRYYPEKNLLSQVLGFVAYKGDSREGLYGLEKYFNSELAGSIGELKQEKDAGGAWIFGSDREYTPAVDGVSRILTREKSIKFKAQEVIRQTVEKHGADSASVVIVNPKTGAVLAMANYPDFDLNAFNKVENPKTFLNETVWGSYEPGSVFKPLTMATSINEGKITPDTTYNDTGVVEIDGYKIKNSDGKGHGIRTMTQVLEQSLNTGSIFAKEQVGNEVFLRYLKNFGFGQKTGIELPEAKGNLDNLKANIKVNFDTASFGQGISVTPIQLVKAFMPIANGGKIMQPYIVQAKIHSDGKVENAEPKVVSQIISDKTSYTVSAMMVNVVENGHGKKAGVPGYYIAGKTGTAQVARKDGKPGYEENNNIGSFIGFGPVENPQFLMLVRVNHPRDVDFAESTAAPAFGELAQFILNYYHIPPTREIKK